MTTAPMVGDRLAELLDARSGQLRPASQVMAPEVLGAARLHRYSFSRTLLRRMADGGWRVTRPIFDLDDQGRGQAVYQIDLGGRAVSFVAYTKTIDESEHSDRVVATNWEISACLVEGVVDHDDLRDLEPEVVGQESGRFTSRVMVLTRGNRSVRFFEYVIDQLATGEQPDPDQVADAGYLMRSTAFYGNGKFGMRSFLGYENDHPLRVPYRAQALCAWLFRELSLDTVEHCAHRRGGHDAVGLDDAWRCYFGLGNATGLGLVPYAFNHPRVLHAWVAAREIALANVRAMPGTPDRHRRLREVIARAVEHFGSGTAEDCTPFLSPQALAPAAGRVAAAFDACADAYRPYGDLYLWAADQDVETTELVVSLLIELDTEVDELIDELLLVDEAVTVDPTMTVGQAGELLGDRFGWIDDLDLRSADADHYWWVISQNNEEPRRVPRERVEDANQHEPIDIALRIDRLRTVLEGCAPDETLSSVLARFPEQRCAVERLLMSDRTYGEPRDNPCDRNYLPLQLQRLQLAMYGMDNFKPKSTDWLRVTFFQGAPRAADFADAGAGAGAAFADDWIFPVRPVTG